MAHCFSVVDNFDGKFVKAIMELPFTGEFVTDGWLPNILVFSLLIVCLATKPRYATERPSEQLTHKFSDLNSFHWKNAGEKFIGESGLVLSSSTFSYLFYTCYKD